MDRQLRHVMRGGHLEVFGRARWGPREVPPGVPLANRPLKSFADQHHFGSNIPSNTVRSTPSHSNPPRRLTSALNSNGLSFNTLASYPNVLTFGVRLLELITDS